LKAVAQKLATVMTTSPDSRTRSSDTAGDDERITALVLAARRGDHAAWTRLVERFDPMLRNIARSYRLNAADVDDCTQATWTLLYSHIGSIREPAAVAGWLATTVRRQALRILQTHTREQLTDNPDFGQAAADTPETMIIEAERHELFVRALASLPARQRRLVTLLASQPALDYQQLGEILEMPMGSIGPTRARGLARLERDAGLRSLMSAA
jgi:RNA polymerase sigma factor (sigma-70 family)